MKKIVSILCAILMTISAMVIMGPEKVYAYGYVHNGVDYSVVFNPEFYYNANPDIKAAIGYNPTKLFEHFLNAGMSEGRVASEDFNVNFYKSTYEDLRAAFGDDMPKYYFHYIMGGRYEGRKGIPDTMYKGVDYSDVYDVDYYYSMYPDIRAAYGYNPRRLIQHFVDSGMSEGRIAKFEFDVEYYKNTYRDLYLAFGDNIEKYYTHYMLAGKYEGRVCYSESRYMGVDYSEVYNKDVYYSNYYDIRTVIGYDAKSLISHFVNAGMSEGRVASTTFDVIYYKNAYPDVKMAYGDDLKSYYLHYMRSGISEGRKGNGLADYTGWYSFSGNEFYYYQGKPVTNWQKIDGRQYYFNSAGILKTRTGVDVSSHNKEIDWNKVKNDGIDYAIIRIGYGGDYADQDDKTAIYNMTECERLGIPYGVYLYSYALTEEDVDSEIQHTLRMIQGRNPSLGVYYDMEDADKYKQNHGMPSNEMLNKFCLKFVQGMTNAGYKSGVYASFYWFTNVINSPELDGYIKWVAQWADRCTYQKAYHMWQYTSDGSVDGINGRADLNVLLEN